MGNKFSIDESTGALSARRLDRETRGSYRLEVTAQDRGSPARRDTCTLDVRVQDENDNDPVFQQNSYEVGGAQHGAEGDGEHSSCLRGR